MHLKLIYKQIFILTALLLICTVLSAQKKQNITINELDSVISLHYNSVQKINLGDIDMLPIYDCTLNETEFAIEALKNTNAFKSINTSDAGFIEMYRKYNDLLTTLPKLRVIIDQYVAYHDYWLYKKGLELLLKGDSTNADHYFDKSLMVNPFYIPSVYQKALISLGRNNITQAAYLLEGVSNLIYADDVNLNLINALIDQIRKHYSNYGNFLLAHEDYNASLELFMEADTFCHFYNRFDCEAFQHGISLSKYGLYHSYLKVANQALEANKLSIAETFILKAKDYSELNRTYITTDADADKYVKKLSKLYMELAFSYKNDNQTKQSDYYFQKADALCKLIKDNDCSKIASNAEKSTFVKPIQTTIASNQHKNKTSHHINKKKYTKQTTIASNTNHKKKIYTHKKKHVDNIEVKETETNSTVRNSYWKYIDEGNAYSKENKFQLAIDNYLMAKSLEATASFKTYAVLDSLVKDNAKKIISNDLQTGGFMVWANELANADSIYNRSVRVQKQYSLENDEEVNASLILLRQKMQLKDCQNIQDKIDMNTAMAKNNIAMKDYVRAGNLLDEVLNSASQHKNCVLLTINAEEARQQIKAVTDYYKYKEDAKVAYVANDLKAFTQKFHAADILYINAKLDTAKITNSNIVEFLRFKNNIEATYYAAKYYADVNDWDGCLELLKLLKDENYPSNKTEDLQVALAKAKALTDSHKTFKLSVTTMITNYTVGDKWFKYFNKTYKAAY